MYRTMNASEFEIDAQSSDQCGLSAVLRLLDVEAHVYFNGKVCGNWRLTERLVGVTCFHVATTGSFILDVPGVFHGALGAGDLVIFPRELPHSMVPAVPQEGPQRIVDFRLGREVEGTGLLCGEFRFAHRASHHVLDALPDMFIVRFDPANFWLRSLLDIIIGENMSGGIASGAILDKLSELLFAYALRHYIATAPGGAGVLSLYANPRLARSVSAMQAQPAHDWTLVELARLSGMSRTSYADTFRASSGWTPLQYLGWWRMQLAWSHLTQGETVAEVASRVGYRSEAAFSRAFQRQFSQSAGHVRRHAAAVPSPMPAPG